MEGWRNFWMGLIGIVGLGWGALEGAEPSEEAQKPPLDTCLVELIAPPGARVWVDGRDYGNVRRFTYSSLGPGKYYSSQIRVSFPSGAQREYPLLVRGGRTVRLAAVDPTAVFPELVVQHGHSGGETVCGVLSPDERYLLTGGRDRTVILWEVATGRKLRSYRGHGGPVVQAAFLPDGRRFLSTSLDQTAILWDLASGEKIRSFPVEAEHPCTAVSPDGRLAAATGPANQAAIWDLETGQQLRALRGHSLPVVGVAFSPNGRMVGTCSLDGRAIIWDAASGVRLQTLGEGNKKISCRCIRFSPDSQRVAIGYQGVRETIVPTGAVAIWEIATGRKVRQFELVLAPSGNNLLAFSPDGRKLLVSAFMGVILFDIDSGKRLVTRRMTGMGMSGWDFPMPLGVFFLQDGRPIVIGNIVRGSLSLTPCIVEIENNRILHQFAMPSETIPTMGIDPKGKRIAAAAGFVQPITILLEWDKKDPIRLFGRRRSWDFRSFAPIFLKPLWSWDWVEGHLHGITCVSFAPSEDFLATGSTDTSLLLWDLQTGKNLRRFVGHQDFPSPLWSLAEYSQWLLNDELVGSLPKERHNRKQFKSPGFIRSVAFSGDGRWMVSGGADNMAILWDVATGKKIKSFEGHEAEVISAAISPDNRRLVTGSVDGTVIVWDIGSGNKIFILSGPPIDRDWAEYPSREIQTKEVPFGAPELASAFSMALKYRRPAVSWAGFSPDGRWILATFWDGTIVVWESATGRHVRSLRWPESAKRPFMPCHPAAFSPDGREFATGEGNGTVLVWDFASGQVLREFYGHLAEITAVEFTPDGERVISSSADGTIRIWDIGSGQCLATLMPLEEGTEWLVVSPEGLFDGSAGGREKVMFRVGQGLQVAPVDRLFQDFYYPGLLAAIMAGERPVPQLELSGALPPVVKILKPEGDVTVQSSSISLEVEVTDQGGGIQGPWLFHNGVRVLAPGAISRQGKSLRRTFEVRLLEGENRLQVRASTADGAWESEPAGLTVRYSRQPAPPDFYLLSVGIGRYAEGGRQLRFARQDAQAIADLFRQRGPQLYGNVSIYELLDEQATKAAILGNVRKIAARARPRDTMLVFLAGQSGMWEGRYYFLPYDFQQQDQSLSEALRSRALSDRDLEEAVAAAPALKRMVIFDTGQWEEAAKLWRAQRDPLALQGAVERMSRSTGQFTLAVAAEMLQMREDGKLNHGVLTYTLLAGLGAASGGPLQNRWIQPQEEDRLVRVLPWYQFASAHVPRLSQQLFGQTQHVYHSGLGTSFPVLPAPSGQSPPERPPRSEPSETAAKEAPKPSEALSGQGAADLYLLAIGINRYRESALNLDFAREDARAMAELFRRRGPAMYRNVHISELFDQRATKKEILLTLHQIAQKARAEDTLIVTLSGHGLMVGQRYYLIPHEFSRQSQSFEEDIRTQGLAADVLGDALGKVPAQRRLLIFDTCASGGALELSQKGRDIFAFRGVIEALGQQQGVFVIAATAAGSSAVEIPELKHGLLSYALLAGMRAVHWGPLANLAVSPSNPDGSIEVLDWLSFAAGQVPRLSRYYSRQEQHVQIAAQGMSFPVLPAKGFAHE